MLLSDTLSYTRLLETIIGFFEIPCEMCGFPIEEEDVMQIDMDRKMVMYYCIHCRYNGSSNIPITEAITICKANFDLKPEDFKLDAIITKNGDVINRKINEEQLEKNRKNTKFLQALVNAKDVSYIDLINIIVENGKLECFNCKMVLGINQIQSFDVKEKKIEYNCPYCGNYKGHRYLSSIHQSLPFMKLHLKEKDFETTVKIKIDDKIVNDEIKIVRCDICGKNFNHFETERLNDGKNACKSCIVDTFKQCKECKKARYKNDFIKIDNLKIEICNDCYEQKFKICKSCENVFRNYLFTGDLCIFCHPIEHFKKINVLETIRRKGEHKE